MLRILLALSLLSGCTTSFNFKHVALWEGPTEICGVEPTHDEIVAAAQEYADGNYRSSGPVVIVVTGTLQPIEFVFVNGEDSVYAWRAWVTMSRQLKSGSHTADQTYSFAMRDGLRIATWYPATSYTSDGSMPQFSFAPQFKDRDGR